MAVSDGENILVYRELGPGQPGLQRGDARRRCRATSASGTRRYSTTGSTTWENAQPAFKTNGDRAAWRSGHNGNLVNTAELAEASARPRGRSTTDSDLVRRRSWPAHARTVDLEVGACEVLPHARGRVLVRDDGRADPLRGAATRTACGRSRSGGCPSGFCVASETCALDIVGATYVRESSPASWCASTTAGCARRGSREAAHGALPVRVRLPRPRPTRGCTARPCTRPAARWAGGSRARRPSTPTWSSRSPTRGTRPRRATREAPASPTARA